MDGFSAAIVVSIPTMGAVATIVYSIHKADTLIRDLLTPRLLGAVVNNKSPKVPTVVAKQPMPEHIKALALVESEEWAKEQMIQAMNEMYEETGDWMRVAELFSGAQT